jgi:surface-anchored protein
MEHVHFEMNFADGVWQKFDLLDDTHGVYYKPHHAILFIGPQDLTTQQPGYEFVGAGEGNSFYETPLDTNASTPYTSMAVEAENIPSNTFDFYQPDDARVRRAGEWMKLDMLRVNGPGYVSMWQDAQIARGQWWMSSFDGGQTFESAIYIEPGGHIHVHWGFTQAGVYEVQFQVSAMYGGTPLYSHPVVLTFDVDTGTDHSGGNPLPDAAGSSVLGTSLSGLSLALPLSADGAPLASTVSNSVSAKVPTDNAPILEAVHADGFFASRTSADHGFVLGLVALPQAPAPLDAGLGDVLQAESVPTV